MPVSASSLRGRRAFAALGLPALVVLFLAAAAAWFFFSFIPAERAKAVESWRRGVSRGADSRKNAIQRYFVDRLADAEVIASYPSVHQVLGAASTGGPTAAEGSTAHLEALFDSYVRIHGIVGVAIWDAGGKIFAKSHDSAIEPACTAPAREVLASGSPATGFHLHGGFGPILTFTAPVRFADGGVRGIVVILEDPRKWLYPLLAQPLGATTSGESFLVDRVGNDILYLSPLRHRPDEPLTFRRRLDDVQLRLREVLEQTEAVGPYVDYRGVLVLAARRRIPPSPWTLVVKIDDEEAMADFRAETRKTGVVLAALLAAILGIAWGHRQWSERTRGAALAQSESRLGAILDQANDAILIAGPDGRIRFLNKVCEEVYGQSLETLRGRTLTDLRAGGQREAALARLDEILRVGRVVFESEHVRADGSQFPVEVSARVVEIAGEKLIVSVNRDITERKRAEEAIRTSEGRMRSLFDGMLEGYAHCEMLYEYGVPVDWLYLDVNPAFEKLTGLKDVAGRRVTEVIPGIREANPELFEIYGRVASTGEPAVFEDYVPALKIWFSVSAYSPSKGHVVAEFEKISERKRAEEALRRSRETMKELLDASPDSTLLLDREFTVLACNKVMAARLGKSFTEIIGRSVLDFVPLEPAKARALKMGEALQTGRLVRFRDERAGRTFDNTIVPVKDASGRVIQLAIFGRDVTDIVRADAGSKQANARIRQLNRLLKTISEINELIVRTDERETLLSEACRILVEHGGFRMAWIGFVDAASRRVVPKAQAGEGLGYLDGIDIRVDDAPEGRGPTGTTVRTGRHVVAQDLATDATVQPWRQRQLTYGFRSSGAFPLLFGGEVAGALTVYTGDPLEIGDEETALLDELAGDLGFALEALEIRFEHARAVEALRESENRFKSLFENALLGLYRTTPDGTVLMANPSLCRLLGYESFEELKRRNLEEEGFEPSYPRSEFRKRVEEEGVVIGVESYWKRRDGSFVFVRESATAIRDNSGKILYYEGTVEDISERRRAEEALAKSELYFKSLIEHAIDITAVLGPEGDIRYVSPSAERVLGYPPEEVRGSGIFELVHPDDRPELRLRLRRVLEEGTRFETFEGRIRHRDGSWRVLSVSGRSLPPEIGVGGVIVNARDVTDRLKAEEDLRKLERAVEQSPASVVITDVEGRIEYVNRKFAEVTGYSPEEARGQNPRILKSDETPRSLHENLWRTISTGRTWQGEFCNRKKDGGLFWESASISPVRRPDGTISHFVAVKEDITEKRRSAEELAEAQRELIQAQKMEAIGRLAGGVAHDFNNLLTVIQGYGEILRSDLEPGDVRRESLEEILTAAGRATNLTRQLLAFSRKQVSEPRLIRLDDVVNDMAKMLGRLIGEDVEISVLAEADLPQVRMDPSQVEQVVMNLAVNSRDAMPSGGNLTILIEAERLPEPLDGFPERVPRGDWIVLTIADSGTGMSPETLSHVFEPFFTTKEVGRGTGLGLAMVWGIVKQSGGFVHLSSHPGTGTTFRIYLPRAEGTRPTSGVRPAVTRIASETILLVEDEPAVRSLTRTLLETLGYRVVPALDPTDALSIAGRREERIDLLLTDVVMPGMTGPELAAKIRTSRPALKILFMSGYSADVLVDRSGVEIEAALLPKPFSRATLAQKVREVLDESGSPAA